MALGSVATATFTRAEIDAMLKRAMYSEGKVVWSDSVGASSNIKVPDDVDYLTATANENLKVVRGGSARWEQVLSDGQRYIGTIYYTLDFSSSGQLTTSWSRSTSGISTSHIYQLTGYHYY